MKKIPSPSGPGDGLAILRRSEFLADLLPEAFDRISPDLESVIIAPGETLFAQGQSGDDMYLVVSGRMKVCLTQEDGPDLVVGSLRPGMPVGEMQPLVGGRRMATVIAEEATELVRIPNRTLKKLSEAAPETIRRLNREIGRRFRKNQLAAIVPYFFGNIEEEMLAEIEALGEWVRVPSGGTLFRQGETDDSLHLVVTGRFVVLTTRGDGRERNVGEITRGESIGEMSMFTGEARSATILATRESDLIRFDRAAFERLIERHPGVMMRIIETLIKRLSNTIRAPSIGHTVTNVALVPADEKVPLTEFTERLGRALEESGRVLTLTSAGLDRILGLAGSQTTRRDPYDLHLSSWLNEQEAKHRFVLYVADPELNPWSRRCVRQADRVLLVAQGKVSADRCRLDATLAGLASCRPTSPQESLVLIHPNGDTPPTGTAEWLDRHQLTEHYHLRWDRESDFERLGRILTGRAVGLALGGGGARGLAHIGVVKALQKTGIPIDFLGGSSMGAIIAALFARSGSVAEATEFMRSVVRENPFTSYTLPLLSLLNDHKLRGLLRYGYGQTRLEDAWINFFAVSTSLTTAQEVVHRRGLFRKVIRASVAIPGLFTPAVDDRHLLVDGGVLNNLPGDIMASICGGRVILADVGSRENLTTDRSRPPTPWSVLLDRFRPPERRSTFPGMLEILSRITTIGSAAKVNALTLAADLYLKPALGGHGPFDFEALDELVELGYRRTLELLEETATKADKPDIPGL